MAHVCPFYDIIMVAFAIEIQRLYTSWKSSAYIRLDLFHYAAHSRNGRHFRTTENILIYLLFFVFLQRKVDFPCVVIKLTVLFIPCIALFDLNTS